MSHDIGREVRRLERKGCRCFVDSVMKHITAAVSSIDMHIAAPSHAIVEVKCVYPI
jgi:hypothetical protein